MDLDIGHMPGATPAGGHEERDTNIRAIMWFAFSLIATVIVVLLLMKWVFYAFPQPQAENTTPFVSALGAAAAPPEPRLQVNAPEDLKKMRAQEESLLNSYGWIDRQKGIVRIPIDRAIDELVKRGLPPLKSSDK